MVTEQQQQQQPPDWSFDLIDSLWFRISNYLNINDIHRLSRTCSRLHSLCISNDFWSHLIRAHFGPAVWHRFIKKSTILPIDNSSNKSCLHHNKPSRSKSLYLELLKRKRISFADFDRIRFDTNRPYATVLDSSSLIGSVLHIRDSIHLCYSLHIEATFERVLPGRYDVVWRMKLSVPYILGNTEFFAVAEQSDPGQIAYTRWTQEDFLSMYRCFNCETTQTNLWFYQTMGIVEVVGNEPCNVHVSMSNEDQIHAKHGVFLDFVELKLRLE